MRPEHLASLESLQIFLRSFEEGSLPKTEWTHGAHVAAAAYYLQEASSDGRYDAACDIVLPHIRERIRAYNLAVGGSNSAVSGYHETLTRFWLHVVAAWLRDCKPEGSLEAARLAVGEFGEQRGLHTQYYSGEVAKNSAARLAWREPDLKALP
jgi:hypothetical protein